MTLPSYKGLYFQGVAANIQSETFGFKTQKYNSEMIILASQLSNWGETSANQTIAFISTLKTCSFRRLRSYSSRRSCFIISSPREL